jgi:hypothetical protein
MNFTLKIGEKFDVEKIKEFISNSTIDNKYLGYLDVKQESKIPCCISNFYSSAREFTLHFKNKSVLFKLNNSSEIEEIRLIHRISEPGDCAPNLILHDNISKLIMERSDSFNNVKIIYLKGNYGEDISFSIMN